MRFKGLILGYLVLVAFGAGCLSSGRNHPTDAEMIRKFQEHRDEFDELITMFRSDRNLGRVGPNFTRSATGAPGPGGDAQGSGDIGVTSDRLNDYLSRFAKLGIRAGIEGYNDKEYIYLHVSSQGLSITGTSKGYAYISKPPDRIVENLDTYWSEDGRSFSAYRRMEGNWYLYFDYED